jgi:hypothetical protein
MNDYGWTMAGLQLDYGWIWLDMGPNIEYRYRIQKLLHFEGQNIICLPMDRYGYDVV